MRLQRTTIARSPTGISGLDEITMGGLPTGRPTLICGGPGCGKTLFAMEFLVRGATELGENGVFMSFEESAQELTANVASLSFDLEQLQQQKKLEIDYGHVDRNEIEETGEYDLEGLFVRIRSAIESVGAKRIVLDTLETLFGGLTNATILRSELRRLFRWLKDQGVTAVITAERGEAELTRHGLEEYVSDCVILLDHVVDEQRTTRTLRVVKYRGSTHGTPDAGARRSDSCRAHAGAPAAGADEEADWRPFEHRKAAGRARPAPAGPSGEMTASSTLKSQLSKPRKEVRYVLKLYATGASARSVRTIRRLKNFCEEHLQGRYKLDVIDIFQRPPMARDEQIIATPTLIKVLPVPIRRFVGDLTDAKLLLGLDLRKEK